MMFFALFTDFFALVNNVDRLHLMIVEVFYFNAGLIRTWSKFNSDQNPI